MSKKKYRKNEAIKRRKSLTKLHKNNLISLFNILVQRVAATLL